MKPLIGIMQGRLSPPQGGRIQSFPVETWGEEFELAARAGLSHIEWIYEKETEEVNPLRTEKGIAEIRSQVAESGVCVRSVCADYFMSERLIVADGTMDKAAVGRLQWLIERTARLSARHIVLPFVDSSSLTSTMEFEALLALLDGIMTTAENFGVELHLETDLLPALVAALMERVSHPRLRLNYDIGNSAALGYEPRAELTQVARWIGSVHVKDRLRGGGTVALGTGNANFRACFEQLCGSSFERPFTLQAAREEGLTELALAIRNRKFVEEGLMAAAQRAVGEPGTPGNSSARAWSERARRE